MSASRFGLYVVAALLAGCDRADPPAPLPSEEVSPAAMSVVKPAAAEPRGTATDAAVGEVLLALDAEGLRAVIGSTGRTTPLTFGMERADIERVAERAGYGDGTRSSLAECPSGAMEFTRYRGWQLVFQDGGWVGWSVGEGAQPRLTTLDGIGIGSTRREMEASRQIALLPDSTLGVEFVLAPGPGEVGIAGLLDGAGASARVSNLWAGLVCNFR